MKRILGAIFYVLLLVVIHNRANATTIDFESLSDSESVTNQFLGLTFTHALALTSGISLNEFELPPHSGVNVLFDDGGAISIVFATPQNTVSGFFTYAAQLTFTAFDAANNIVDTEISAFNSNFGLSGDPGSSPNEHLSLAFAGGISRTVIEGNTSGGSFVLDDLSFNQVTTTIPEPSTLLLFISALTIAIGWQTLRRFKTGRNL